MKKLILLFLLLAIICMTGFSQDFVRDSVLQVLNSMPSDTSRLEYLNKELSEDRTVAKNIQYARLLVDEAKKQKNDSYRGKAYSLY